MILSQARKTGYWTEFRVTAETGRPVRLRRYDPRLGFPLVGRLGFVHDPKRCANRGCAIHNHPSDHPLKDAPMLWRDDAGKLERICPHGIGHDDHDSVEWAKGAFPDRKHIGVHGCDGCCA